MKKRNKQKKTTVEVTPQQKDFFSDRTKNLIAFSFLALLFIIFYAQLLSGTRFLWEDYTEQAYPNVRFAAGCLREGTLPLWTPFIFGGMPFAADPQSTLFYPPFWIYLFTSLFSEPGGLFYTWYILSHILILGIGTFLLVRNMAIRRSAAIVSATTIMFAGFVSMHVFHTFVYVVAWFPFAFHFLRRALDEDKFRFAAAGGIFLGISTLGGYPQYSMHLIYFCMAWTLFSVFRKGRPAPKTIAEKLISFGLFTGIGLAMAAVQYLPSFENMAQSVRETMTYDASVDGAISIGRLATLFSPSFFGVIAPTQPHLTPFWGAPEQGWSYWETCIFVGVAPLFLALRALIDGKKSPTALFLGAFALISVLLALGNTTPLYSFFFHFVPGFGKFRIPGRFAFLFAVCIMLLAGTGMHRLLTDTIEQRRRYLKVSSGLAGAVLLFCMLYFTGMFSAGSEYLQMAEVQRGATNAVTGTILTTLLIMGGIAYIAFKPVKGWMGFAVAGFTFLELYTFGHTFAVSDVNPKQYYEKFNLSSLKQQQAEGVFRVQGRIYRGEGAGELLFPRNIGNVTRIPFVDGYNQLLLSRWNDLMWKVDPEKARQLFNVRYLKKPGEFRLLPVGAAPRFFLTTDISTVTSRDDAISSINSATFIPGRHLVCEAQPELPIEKGVPCDGTIRAVKETINRIELSVTAPANCMLSVSELYYPAWKAKLDGKKTEIIPANCAFRGIPVPKGTHRVVMYFQSDPMMLGGIISLTALLFALLLLFGDRNKQLRTISNRINVFFHPPRSENATKTTSPV